MPAICRSSRSLEQRLGGTERFRAKTAAPGEASAFEASGGYVFDDASLEDEEEGSPGGGLRVSRPGFDAGGSSRWGSYGRWSLSRARPTNQRLSPRRPAVWAGDSTGQRVHPAATSPRRSPGRSGCPDRPLLGVGSRACVAGPSSNLLIVPDSTGRVHLLRKQSAQRSRRADCHWWMPATHAPQRSPHGRRSVERPKLGGAPEQNNRA
jgi:hypothetical protein